MAQVITFEDYVPPARYDAVAWTAARIEEAATSAGPWSQIDELTLTPVDSDPVHPASRDLTTSLADDAMNLWYRIIFVDAGSATSRPTDPVQNQAHYEFYVSAEQLKATMGITTDQWNGDLERAAFAASKAIDDCCDTVFKLVDESNDQVRVYTPTSPMVVVTDDFAVLTSVFVDSSGNGTFDQEWELGTHFVAFPENAFAKGEPVHYLRPVAHGRVWPTRPQSVEVTGRVGWLETPWPVVEAAGLLAQQLFKRRREVTFGVLGLDQQQASRVLRSDPHLMMLLDRYMRTNLVA